MFWPVVKGSEWLGRNHPAQFVRLRYLVKFHKRLNLDHPRDLNEKILWMKVYADTSRWTELADKYRVRGYVEKLGLGEHLVKLYGAWGNEEDIDFAKLPNEVIFKANNGDGVGTNLIVRNLHKGADHAAIKRRLRGWLQRRNVGVLSAEPHYKGMTPMVIAEEVLPLPKGQSTLIDYKIWCIGGEPQYVWTCSDRDADGGGADVMTYDLGWNAHPEFSVFTPEFRRGKLMEKPKNLDKMVEIARKLSQGFPLLRVDLYNIDGKIYFGELTFTSQGGMMDYYTPEFLQMLGKKVLLPPRKNHN